MTFRGWSDRWGGAEFERLTEELADYEDLKDLRAARGEEGDVPGKGLDEVRQELGL